MTRSLTFCLLMVTSTSLFAADPANIVYDFSATWCGPCQQMAPLVARLEREGLSIRKVDIDQEKSLAEKYSIASIPTFVLVVDGKEVERKSGAMTETDLRRMVGKIPSTSAPLVAQDTNSPGIELGQPAPMTQPAKTAELVTATNEKTDGKSPLQRLNPFGKKSADQNRLTIRGNDSETDNGSQQVAGLYNSADPMESSVRIRVSIDGKINLGSGTIIDSREGLTKILTCAHIFRGINEDSKIEVDFMINNREQPHIARLENFDEKADLGLISVATTTPLPIASIAMSIGAPKVGEPLVGIGCSAGDEPTPEQLKVTAVDKYVGPHNIECTGLPVRGRSGGGLFNNKGEVVGVCIAADREAKRGLYSGLLAVHNLLSEGGLAHLYQPAQAQEQSDSTSIASTDDSTSTIPGDSEATSPKGISWSEGLSSNASVESSAPMGGNTKAAVQPVDLQTGHAEVVVIIRDPSQPNGQNRVVIIHDASSKFLSYLNGELDVDRMGNNLKMSQNESMQTIDRDVRAIATSLPASHSTPQGQRIADGSSLELTSLSQPAVPRRYVRTSRSTTGK